MVFLREKVFCAFCKHEKKVYKEKCVNQTYVVLCLLASFCLVFSIWQTFHFSFFIFFPFLLIFTEVFLRVRWRISIICSYCGFDPILYKEDPRRACLKVQKTLDDYKSTGRHLLSAHNPFLNLPKRKTSDDVRISQKSKDNGLVAKMENAGREISI